MGTMSQDAGETETKSVLNSYKTKDSVWSPDLPINGRQRRKVRNLGNKDVKLNDQSRTDTTVRKYGCDKY